MTVPKLSICIATYNRGKFIAETLDSILCQIPSNVELIVVDGASPDDTSQVMAQYISRYSHIRYFREQENSGIDRDYDKAVGYATGEYCWLMTDDDLLHPGAIRRVLDALNGDVDLLVVNSEVRNADLSVVLEPRRINLEQDREYNHAEAETAFSELANSLSFIGCTVVRRDVWMARDRASYYGTLFVHVGVIFQSPPLERIKVIAQPQIIIRYGNAMWTARGFEIWMFKWPQLIWSFPAFSGQAKVSVCPAQPWKNVKKLFLYRAIGGYSLVEYRRFFSGSAGSALRLLTLVIAILPASLANFFASAYCVFLNRNARVGLYDLTRSRNATWVSRFLVRFQKT
jgi:abequosyltransferase